MNMEFDRDWNPEDKSNVIRNENFSKIRSMVESLTNKVDHRYRLSGPEDKVKELTQAHSLKAQLHIFLKYEWNPRSLAHHEKNKYILCQHKRRRRTPFTKYRKYFHYNCDRKFHKYMEIPKSKRHIEHQVEKTRIDATHIII